MIQLIQRLNGCKHLQIGLVLGHLHIPVILAAVSKQALKILRKETVGYSLENKVKQEASEVHGRMGRCWVSGRLESLVEEFVDLVNFCSDAGRDCLLDRWASFEAFEILVNQRLE